MTAIRPTSAFSTPCVSREGPIGRIMSVAPDQVTYSQLVPLVGGVVAKENREFALAVGARLRLLEKALGMSGTEICRELGIPDANCSSYKMGDSLLRPHIAGEL